MSEADDSYCDPGYEQCLHYSETIRQLVRERDEARAALATARREALEEAAKLVEYRDPSNPFAPRNDREQILAAAIRALIDRPTDLPAPATPQAPPATAP